MQRLGRLLQSPLLRWMAWIAFFCYLGLVFASFFEADGWPMTMLAHFRLQWTMLGLGFALVYLFSRRWVMLLLALGAMVTNLLMVWPYLAPAPPPPQEAQTIRLTAMNLWVHNRQADMTEAAIKALNPDVLLLIEMNPWWHEQLWASDSLSAYPYRWWSGAGTQMAVVSKVPLDAFQLIDTLNDAGQPIPYGGSLETTMTLNQRQVSVVSVHTPRPTSPKLYQAHLNVFSTLAQRKNRYHDHLILMGDFNATPFTGYFQRFLTDLELTNTLSQAGLQGSWPTFLPPAYIPIDHALVGPGIEVVKRQVGPYIGSDHLPVTIDIVVQ